MEGLDNAQLEHAAEMESAFCSRRRSVLSI